MPPSFSLSCWRAAAGIVIFATVNLLFQNCLVPIEANIGKQQRHGAGSSVNHDDDRISKLPGQPAVEFQQYAGYVTVDEKMHKALFYYLVEAEADPVSKPLVLWLNGGPGCSSLGVGALSENGPFRPKGELLVRNEYSWNKEANMLYLETPVGVGFSYAVDSSAYDSVSDAMTARDNLIFMIRWFDKFPKYKHRDFFITGESYAGHYIPQLAQLMVQMNKKKRLFNLKGIALGNPVLEFKTDFNSRAEYFWSHGLISDSTYKLFTSRCNYSRYVTEYYKGSVSPTCLRVMGQVSRETSRFVDKYDVTLDVCISSVLSQSKIMSPHPQQASKSDKTIDVCVEDETVNYLNRRDVQKALHAQLVNVRRWEVCSNILDYVVLDVQKPTITIVGSLINNGIPVLVYSGDQDSVIPLTGSRTLVHQLAQRLKLNYTLPYRVWFAGQQVILPSPSSWFIPAACCASQLTPNKYQHTETYTIFLSNINQVGGWTQVYGNILSFATVRGASHEAPFSQPQRSLVLFKSFLQRTPLPDVF